MKYTIEECVFLVESRIKSNSLADCQNMFAYKYPDSELPSRPMITKLFRKWRTTGSVGDAKRIRRSSVLTQEKLELISQTMQNTPTTSLRRLAARTNTSLSSSYRAVKKLKLFPYKIMVVQELKPVHHVARVAFCEWMLQSVNDGEVDPFSVLYTDEAWFHLSGYVNSQNSRYWSATNPHQLHETPLHDLKVGVWCALSANRIIGPIFFNWTINSQRYVDTILQPFFQQLTEQERMHSYFQQDNATAHTSNLALATINQVFQDRVINRNLWPANSPDLNPCDYYL